MATGPLPPAEPRRPGRPKDWPVEVILELAHERYRDGELDPPSCRGWKDLQRQLGGQEGRGPSLNTLKRQFSDWLAFWRALANAYPEDERLERSVLPILIPQIARIIEHLRLACDPNTALEDRFSSWARAKDLLASPSQMTERLTEEPESRAWAQAQDDFDNAAWEEAPGSAARTGDRLGYAA